MQEEFEQLAGEVNSLAANTQYDRNYLFTTAGETRTVSLDNEFYIHLFPKNLSFEADGLDLTTEPEVALSKTKTAAKLAGEYSQYLTGQLKYLEDAMARQDRELDTTDIDSDGFTTAIAAETVSRITKQIEKNGEPFRQIQQANIIAERAAYLLRVP